ncbi:hypothetical protein E4656_10420 [Natronospirillum operosum]|uniref:Uncharacterized protein n=1 Tax=Natronospirillum operosum TaxID=2759953 RepID=A0A4Z0WC04_9GAMM|nr:hypothetical protein [Natronospirillum operosum]TGG93453.1 hypothetical protein E4656_10420 [Natronospirillum operosum]
MNGASISSSAAASDNGNNSLTTGTLTTEDLHNESSYRVSTNSAGVGTDMLSQGRYGVAKGIAGNVMGHGSDNGSDSGVTASAVSQGHVTLTNAEAQEALTGQSSDEYLAGLNRDTENNHDAVQSFADRAESRLAQLEDEAEVRTTAYNEFTTEVTDDIYAAATAQIEIIRQLCTEGGRTCDGTESVGIDGVVADENGVIRLFNNGINTPESEGMATGFAAAQYEDGVETYTVVNPHTGSFVSELLYAGYDKLNSSTPVFHY